jgi:hypothetical protein
MLQRVEAGDLVVYADKLKALMWTMVAALWMIVAVTLALVVQSVSLTSPLRYPILRGLLVMIGLGLFGSGIVRGIFRTCTKDPILRISHEGIAVAELLVGRHLIPWSEIRTLIVRAAPTQTTLTIVLIDPASVGTRLTPWQARTRRLLQGLFLISRHVVVGDAMLSIPMSAIMATMRQRYHRELAERHIRIIA